MYVRVSEIKLLISFLRAIKSLYQKMHNKTEQNCTHYLSYATLVSYVAFVWAMLLKLPSSYIFGWFWALINTWHSWRIDNCKICQKYCFCHLTHDIATANNFDCPQWHESKEGESHLERRLLNMSGGRNDLDTVEVAEKTQWEIFIISCFHTPELQK